MTAITSLTDKTYEQILANTSISVVKLWQDNCPACDHMTSIYQEVANRFSDISFFEMNKKNCGTLGIELNVVSVPMFIVFKYGKEVWRASKIGPVDWLYRNIEESRQREPLPDMTIERAYEIRDKLSNSIKLFTHRLEKINEYITHKDCNA